MNYKHKFEYFWKSLVEHTFIHIHTYKHTYIYTFRNSTTILTFILKNKDPSVAKLP